MNKTLINNYDSFCSFIEAHTGIIPGHGNVTSDFWNSPETYPCVVIWGIRYDGNGPDELYGEFVYLDDFEAGKMITEDYVSFETAKLLKEKGFDAVCKTAYETMTDGHKVVPCSPSTWGKSNEVKRPTLQMAMKWLREEHNLECDISFNPFSKAFKEPPYWMFIGLSNFDNPYHAGVLWKSHVRTHFDTHEEACEAAIKYCLENLI